MILILKKLNNMSLTYSRPTFLIVGLYIFSGMEDKVDQITIQLWICLVFINTNIFRHLKLGFAFAIPASNE